MNLLNQSHRPCILIVSVGAVLGACTLDTVPESSPSRASLQAEVESSSLDTPREHADSMSAAGAAAPAPAPTQASRPAAAIVPPPPAAAEAAGPEPEKSEPEPEKAAEPAPKQAVDTTGCKPGDYEGVIAGTVNFGPLEVSTLTGKITLRLVTDEQNENLLRVEHGRVEGIDLNNAVFIADITGEVDCSTGELVQSEVERGMYEDTNELLKIGFTGAAEGHYSADPPALLGTWNISDDSTLLAGQGTWTTTLAESLR